MRNSQGLTGLRLSTIHMPHDGISQQDNPHHHQRPATHSESAFLSAKRLPNWRTYSIPSAPTKPDVASAQP